MYKIIVTAVLGLLVILGLNGQGTAINAKTKSIEKKTIYFQLKTSNDEAKVFEVIDNYFKNKEVQVFRRRMFPNSLSSELKLIYRVDLSNDTYSDDFVLNLNKVDLFQYIEFAPYDLFYATPNDLHVNQWHLQKIAASQAWDIRIGDPKILVAIVDDAIDIKHEDLQSVMFVNSAEIANNGIDDDGNGYVDDRLGWNSTYKIGNPNPPFNNRSMFSHGTHCAGIAAAATNNSIGIASIGYGISILPIACSDSTRPGQVASGYEGIIYAIDAGARVISLSWGGSSFSNTGQKVMDYAASKNIVVVAAAGNDNSSIRTYPSSFNGVISVAASNDQDLKANFSNYGNW
ncbi:MAG: S8 family serine peptidase, partial [Bacteroidia bacterium]|nr:S8 family serine peptidase [Bacteroidia bacterium]